MKLSRKRRRELRRLQNSAQQLLDQQRIVLGNAGDVVHEASKQAKRLGNEHLMPRIDETVEAVRPTVDRGVASARRAANNIRRISTPIVASALATTIQKLHAIEQVETARQVRNFGERTGYIKPANKKRGARKIVVLSIGITAASGVGYALWQAFRTDDEMWTTPENE